MSRDTNTKEENRIPQTSFGKYKTIGEYSSLGLDRFVSSNRDYLISFNYLTDIVKGLEGVVLTLIESTTEDREKRESAKSIARTLIWNQVREIRLLELKKEE